jgi:DNA replication ATP-dependent helicase Dna2
LSSLTELHTVLTDFVRDESRVQRDQHLKHLHKPIEDRVEEERCLADLRCEGEAEHERKSYRFRAGSGLGNTSRFREGDRLRLHRGDYEAGIDVILTRESEHGVELRATDSHSRLSANIATNPAGWVLDEGFFDSEKMLLEGLERAMASADGRDRILSLFAGTAQDEMDFGLDDILDTESFAAEAGLNDSQADALTMATSAAHSHLIQGPPGTGKTYVLARTVATLVERGERVLVSAFTHRAIHNALVACHAAIRDPERIAKIGIYHHDPSLAPVPQFESWSKSPLRHVFGGLIVGATPFAAFSSRLADATFDTVVIDEASQMTIPLAILAMLKGRKFLFFGDHRQLPPVLQSIPKRDVGTWSVFGSLVRHSEITTLKTTYRLNADLARWPSESFYSGDLQPHASVADRRTVFPNRPPEHPALAHPASAIFWEVPHEGARTVSIQEADAICGIVEDAVLSGIAPAEIGIVTPYRRQAQRIRKCLRNSASLKDANVSDIVVDTVERFQGQEREIVLLSLTTSDPEFLTSVGDFFFQEERWNVAATRARSKLILVASPALLDFSPFDTDLQESVSLVHALLQSATRLTAESES